MLKGRLKNLSTKRNTRFVLVLILLLVCLGEAGLALNPNKNPGEFGNQVWLTENGLPQNTVQTIIQTHDGYLWFGTQDGLAKFNGTNFIVFDRENTPQLKSNDIRSLFEDRNGNLWIGTSFGLVRMQGEKFTSYTTAEGLPDNTIGPMIEDRDGTLWIGTGSGLVHYVNNTFKPISIQGVNATDVQSLIIDTTGVVWIGTALGVTSIKNGSEIQTKAMSALAGLSVNSMVEDQTGRIWYGTDTRLAGIANNEMINLTIDNGLPDNHVII